MEIYMYDVIIIGSGPAGISAALNLKLHNKNILWFGSRELSAKVEKSEMIANYPGIPMVKGADLNRAYLSQIDGMGLTLKEEMVTNIVSSKRGFSVLGGNEIYDAKSIILAVGASSAKGFVGEEELLGCGVSYCATCDGFLYKGKTVGVYCGSERYEHEVGYLAGIAKTVYLFAPYKNVGVELPNVIKPQSPIVSVNGEGKISSVTLQDGEDLPLDGLFVLRNSVAPATLMRGLELDGVHIKVDREMKTNKAGCFACGDCTGRPYQLAKAVGEGNVAAHSAIEYLSELDKKI